MTEDWEEKCDMIEEEIMAISDLYPNYISKIIIKWKEEP